MRSPKVWAEYRRHELARGAPQEIFKIWVSEIAFPAFWEHILKNLSFSKQSFSGEICNKLHAKHSNTTYLKLWQLIHGNLSLKIKSRTQQITLKPNIMKVKHLLANVSLFSIQHLQSNLNEFTGYGIYIYKIMVYYYKNGYIVWKNKWIERKENNLSVTS
jgi:hypothetical protein